MYNGIEICSLPLAFQLVSIFKTMALPIRCLMTAWENLQEEFEPTEGEDQITLLETFNKTS